MILLLGGSGYVGTAFSRRLTELGWEFQSVTRHRCDYTQPDVLRTLIADTRPTFLINAAGYTGKPNVEACENHKAECLSANAVLPGLIADVCRQQSLPWGHVSSGCIYQGTRDDGTGFRESDPPNFCFRSPPCSFYSGCKALGEECLHHANEVYVWRLRVPFSNQSGPRNLLTKLIRYERLLDTTNSLADLNEFVDACLHCWINRVPFGIYNVVNSGAITTREIVDLICRHRMLDRRFRFFADETEFMRKTAGVPRSSCVLDNQKLSATGFSMREVHEAVTQALKRWQE